MDICDKQSIKAKPVIIQIALGGGCPFQAKQSEGGFTSYPERIDARKVRARSQSFFDHFSQAKLFFNSQTEPEKNHIVDAFLLNWEK